MILKIVFICNLILLIHSSPVIEQQNSIDNKQSVDPSQIAWDRLIVSAVYYVFQYFFPGLASYLTTTPTNTTSTTNTTQIATNQNITADIGRYY